jgi:hypothetical protein
LSGKVHRMSNATFALSLCLAGCASAIAMPDSVEVAPKTNLSIDVGAIADTDLAFARAVGPVGLEQMLAKYDRLHGSARDALAAKIDKVAAQKYATVSRLFWYTELDRAKAAAAAEKKPILALRMLGRLDEDLSCANSRFFRATLYANKDVSAYLKQNFVLYWSSERDVPKVTIDFGDGRKIASTTTGNSAHYILDENGDVLDVLPGLYAPHAFKAELAKSLVHAKNVAAAPAHQRGAKIAGYHQAKVNEIRAASSKLNVYALGGTRVSSEMAIALAQRATMAKARIEVPQLRKITTAELKSIDEDEVSTWATFAEQLWPSRTDESHVEYTNTIRVYDFRPIAPARVFDEQSLALVDKLHGDAPEKGRMLARFAESVRADSALNQLRLRAQIAAFLAKGTTDFAQVNDFIYANVFHTPKSDAWLGLHDQATFTGLPGGGVTMPAKAAQR